MARFGYDATGVNPAGGYEPLPEGEYDLKITAVEPGKTSNGDNRATVTFHVINSIAHVGKEIRYHNVNFIPPDKPGAGFAISFLKAIGEPWQGKFQVDTDKWIGKVLRADVLIEEYEKTMEDGKKEKRKKNVVKNVRFSEPFDDVSGVKAVEEEIPF